MNRIPVIAIDGPSASGKGTVAQALARALGFHYLDSGALYRLVALAAINGGADLGDEAALTSLAAGLDARFAASRRGSSRTAATWGQSSSPTPG